MRVSVVSPSPRREWWHDAWGDVRQVAPTDAERALAEDAAARVGADVVIVDARRSEALALVEALASRTAPPASPVVVYGAARDPWLAMAFLDAGASDYLTPLMAREELAARVRAAARGGRGSSASVAARTAPRDARPLGRVFVTPAGDEIWADGHQVRLTRNESVLLQLLAGEPRGVVPYGRLISGLWGDAEPPTARVYLRAYVRRLREKIEVDPDHPAALVTVRGRGYYIAVEAAAQDTA